MLPGSTFAGWYSTPGFFGDPWDFSTGTVTSNMTLYAKWNMPTIDITGVKMWDDYDNLLNLRPENVTIVLFQNNSVFRFVTISAMGAGTFTFTDLPKFSADGGEYVYTVGEAFVPQNYQAEVNGTTIINILLR